MTSRNFDFTLGDDAPKLKPKDDRLGYAQFAENIAKTAVALKAPNGYVIGIHGAWGSGKSTVLNFVTHYVDEFNKESEESPLVHIDFRPWIVTGHHDLISAFFKILSEYLGPKKTRSRRFFENNRDAMSDASNRLVDAAATVAITMDPSAGIVSRVAGSVAKKSLGSVIERFVEEPSLQKAYENLRKLLKDSGKRFLVTIDDIDRLEDAEVKSIMRMVKSIGQLPNVIYLLSYDREIVWNILDGGADRPGFSFGEKIIQQELELPQPPQNTLLSMLDREIEFLVGNTKNSFRWELLLRDGVHRWVKSPRDVVRLSNAVKFSWPALCDEIDPQDLLGIEGVRLFDTETFAWLRDNRSFLFNEGRFILSEDGVKEQVIEDLKRRVPEGEHSQVLGVITVLFPQLAKWFDSLASFGAESNDDVERRRGIGCEAGYDSYFGLHPSADAVRLEDIGELVAPGANVEDIEKILRRYLMACDSRGAPMIAKVLHELQVRYSGRSPVRGTPAILYALFGIGEEVIAVDHAPSKTELPLRSMIGFLIYEILKQWGQEEAGQFLIEAFERERSAAFLADVYVSRGEEFGIFGDPPREEACISKKDFEALGQVLLNRINSSYEDGTLSDAPFYFNIVRCWVHLSDRETVKSWLTEGIV
ncbi:MAG: P-loop NTPase fold protein, partial [Dehalococcoidia bacterium]|nr:P-loop NTPase fold protein [Dehalococcoidia bacterium]